MRTSIATFVCVFVCSIYAIGDDSTPGLSIDVGTVVLEGTLIPSPFVVDVRDDKVTINGHRLVSTRFLPRRGQGHDVSRGTNSEQIAKVERFLLNDGVIVGFGFDQVAWFGYWNGEYEEELGVEDAFEILALVLADNVRSSVSDLMTRNIVGMEHVGTREWIALKKAFKPSNELLERIDESFPLESEDAIGASGEWDGQPDSVQPAYSSHVPWFSLNTIRYTMTVCGMMLSVIAFGYLIQYRPSTSKSFKEQNNRRRAVQMVYVCLTFIVLLGLFDLVSTLGADNTIHFAELNPLGGWLLSSPAAATAFKLIATGVGVGLLLRFRIYIFAQLASWWMCLVSTLVVFRWVIFRAMMLD